MSTGARDNHEKVVHPNGRTPICNWNNLGCDKRIQNSNHLFNHIRFHHEQKPFPSCKINPLWRRDTITADLFRRCNICEDDFLDLDKHTRCSPCGSNYLCPVCDLQFSESRRLRLHIERHNPDWEIFHCPKEECDKQYATKQGLQKNIHHIHQNKKRVCSYCGKVFSFFGVYFHLHIQKHMGHKPLKQKHCCTYEDCSMEYCTSSGLKDHINACHLGIVFQCDIHRCGKDFIKMLASWIQHCLSCARRG